MLPISASRQNDAICHSGVWLPVFNVFSIDSTERSLPLCGSEGLETSGHRKTFSIHMAWKSGLEKRILKNFFRRLCET
ncbi:hypothetical protein A6X21_11600 [Planctopirus hydrillae]|uniref:Uncharacterized protein n=1 Tax=Planctopirus hydrillae TaxID=1841610 RepID=A0A1C3E5E7_9PLAN|nr:hypothetical protein A6X21_11600 [Planctopirus hydrillae]